MFREGVTHSGRTGNQRCGRKRLNKVATTLFDHGRKDRLGCPDMREQIDSCDGVDLFDT